MATDREDFEAMMLRVANAYSNGGSWVAMQEAIWAWHREKVAEARRDEAINGQAEEA
jgi:hypothetical protein